MIKKPLRSQFNYVQNNKCPSLKSCVFPTNNFLRTLGHRKLIKQWQFWESLLFDEFSMLKDFFHLYGNLHEMLLFLLPIYDPMCATFYSGNVLCPKICVCPTNQVFSISTSSFDRIMQMIHIILKVSTCVQSCIIIYSRIFQCILWFIITIVHNLCHNSCKWYLGSCKRERQYKCNMMVCHYEL